MHLIQVLIIRLIAIDWKRQKLLVKSMLVIAKMLFLKWIYLRIVSLNGTLVQGNLFTLVLQWTFYRCYELLLQRVCLLIIYWEISLDHPYDEKMEEKYKA